MDLAKQVTISSSAARDRPAATSQVSLFEAVRQWTDDEGLSLAIHDDGRRLSEQEIQQIAHSEEYKVLLLAYDERR